MKWPLMQCLLLAGLQLSSQYLVTTVPNHEDDGDQSDIPSTTELQMPNIRSLHVVSDIKYRYATTLVSSRIVNPSNQSAEAAFSITLPESAFISKFLMDVKGVVYNAYVKGKEEARKTYDRAVNAGQFAGHVALGARDSNTFTVSVNIEAQGKVTFNLTYEQLLSRSLGQYSNVININPRQVVKDMSVTVNIEEPTEIRNLEVPEIIVLTNEFVPVNTKENTLAKIVNISTNRKQVVWSPNPEQQRAQNKTGISGQFVVKYDVDRDQDPQQILVNEGYFVHFFAPDNLPKLRIHAVFVLDYSGSMYGRKLLQLKDAMKTILSDLDPTDYFSIVIFDTHVNVWSPAKIYSTRKSSRPSLERECVINASTENIILAKSYLENLSEGSFTNIIGGLRTGLKLVDIGSGLWENESDAPTPVIVFLTDGEPNEEESNTETIIKKTKVLNTKRSPIFSLAFGDEADFNFLRKLSLSNFGFARNIYKAADASNQLKNFYRTIASPLLRDVTFNYLPGQVSNSSNTKKQFPIFFKGSEIVVAGRLNEDAAQDMSTIGEISGLSAGGSYKYPIVIDYLKPENRTLGNLEKAWAYLTIQQLLDKVDSLDDGPEKNQTKSEALELALQYSFVTPLTSLVVVKPNGTESAVDTKKVKPGEYGSSSITSAFPPPIYSRGYISRASYYPSVRGIISRSGLMGYKLIVPPSSSYSLLHLGDLSYSPSMHNRPIKLRPPPSTATPTDIPIPLRNATNKINMREVKWLQQFISNSSVSENVTVLVQGRQYSLGLHQNDTSFGACDVNSVSGECHHFQHCALDVFQDDESAFIPYQCPITGGFLGVCCPDIFN